MDWINEIFEWFAVHKDGVISLGVFIAATASIGGAVWTAKISTRSARKEHLGRMRQTWVDELRTDIAQLLKITTSDPNASNDIISEQNFIASRILLRLTSGNIAHQDLSGSVKNFCILVNQDHNHAHENQKTLQDAANEVVEDAKRVLKEAWDQAAGDLS